MKTHPASIVCLTCLAAALGCSGSPDPVEPPAISGTFSIVAADPAAGVCGAAVASKYPAVGKVVTGDGNPYRYLVESIRTFPNQDKFKAMIEQAGFAKASYRNLTGGVVAIHSGWRI